MKSIYVIRMFKQCNGKQWWWRLMSKYNGQILATSETYKTKNACRHTATKVAAHLLCEVL